MSSYYRTTCSVLRPTVLITGLCLLVLVAALANSFAANNFAANNFTESNFAINNVPVGPDVKQFKTIQTRGVNYLKNSQAKDGSWGSPSAVGMGSLITMSLLRNGVPANDAVIISAVKNITKYVQKDGGIYDPKSSLRNYQTCLSMLLLKELNQKGEYTKIIQGGEKFLRKLQWDGGEGLKESDTSFGGAGYGKHKRPDLSNTQFLIEALKAAGVKKDDPAMKNALKFVSRTQNLESKHNTTKFAGKIDDGGFYYTPAAGGDSKAGSTTNGGLRSYASMTYAGLKSMIYAGVTRDDPRVKAAYAWAQKHYTVTENPGLRQFGLYYYYHTFSKTLSIMNVDKIKDAKGNAHDWRKELSQQLGKVQQKNGSWSNKVDRWYEGNPDLCTAYALMALSYCAPK